MKTLTTPQNKVYDCIARRIRLTGYAPSQRAINKVFGWSSSNASRCVIHALIQKGLLEKGAKGKLRLSGKPLARQAPLSQLKP